MKKFLEVENLAFSYGKKTCLDDVSFDINKNTINALLGANESGKTTLLKLLKKDIPNSYIVFFKENFKNINNTVEKEIIIKSGKKYFSNDDISTFKDLCEVFDVDNIKTKVKDLTIIDKVKIIVISSILSDSSIILLDDVFDLLKYDEYLYICSLIKKVQKKYNVTIIYTTYKLDLCCKANKIMFLNNGKIELSGTFKDIIERDTVLSRNGIVISTMLDLSLKLKFYNLLDEIIMDPDRMVDKLWK